MHSLIAMYGPDDNELVLALSFNFELSTVLRSMVGNIELLPVQQKLFSLQLLKLLSLTDSGRLVALPLTNEKL